MGEDGYWRPSVNENVEDGYVELPKLTEVASLFRNAVSASGIDVSKFFHRMPLSVGNAALSCFKILGIHFVIVRGVMGARSAPKGSITLLEGALEGLALKFPEELLTQAGNRRDLWHVDDGALVRLRGEEPGRGARSTMFLKTWLWILGLPTKDGKDQVHSGPVGVGKSVDHVGWTWYFWLPSRPNMVGMKQDKRLKYIGEFEGALNQRFIPQKTVLSLQGKLANLAQIFIPFAEGVKAAAKISVRFDQGRIEMLDIQDGVKSTKKFVRELMLAVRVMKGNPMMDLNWVARELPVYPYIFASDAYYKAMGGWYTVDGETKAWRELDVDLLRLVPKKVRASWLKSKPAPWHINTKEFIGSVTTIMEAMPHIRGHTVMILCENKTAQNWAITLRNRPRAPFDVVSGFFDWLQAGANIRVEVVWLSTVANTVADAISRLPFSDEIWVGGEAVKVERSSYARDFVRR